MALFQLKNSFEGAADYSIDTPMDAEAAAGEFGQKMKPFADEVEKEGDPKDPIIVYNWLKDGTPEQVAADTAYGIKMMTMLAGYGGGPMHLGLSTVMVQPKAEAGS